jgi:hypothetical protein
MTYLHGTFKDVHNTDVEVQIRSAQGSREIIIGETDNSDVFFSSDPVDISLSLNDMFDVILKKSARITLESAIYLGDILFAGNIGDVSVQIIRNSAVIFDGYVEPNSFNQPWAGHLESFEINCVDKLALLQYRYWTDNRSYSSLLQDVNIYSFRQYLSRIGFSEYNVYYDNSKTFQNGSIWDACGISMNVFLGASEDKVMSYESILTHILRYFNLHIIQEGTDFYIFDWSSISANTLSWTCLFGQESSTLQSVNVTVNKDLYSDNSSSLSMSEVYNQIQVKCLIDDVKRFIPVILDSGELENIYGSKGQLCITEAWYIGGSNRKDAASFFKNSDMFRNENSNSVSASDANAWRAVDWYMKWLTNPRWTLHYKNSVIDSFVPYDNGSPAYQTQLLKLLYENKFMPALISMGSGAEMKNGVSRVSASPQMKNYLVISGCAGWGYKQYNSDGTLNNTYGDKRFNSFAELLNAIDTERIGASGSTGLVSYSSGTALNLSPIDEDTTNFIIIKGSLMIEPVHAKASWGTGGKYSDGSSRPSENSRDNVSWGTMIDWLTYSDAKYFGGHNHYGYYGSSGDLIHYAQVPWTGRTYNGSNTPDMTQGVVYLSPPTGMRCRPTNYLLDRYKYNKSKTSSGWSDSDTINKLSILECEMTVGDKYCVEDVTHLDEYGCPTFHWYTAAECEANGYSNKSFTIGIDPAIGDVIIGKSFQLTNTADGRKTDKKGMCIPVKKSDALSGVVTFRIKGVLDVQWSTYFNQERSYNQSYVHIEGTQHLWYDTSAIWIEDFDIQFDSDNDGKETDDKNSSDILYVSDESHDYLKKRDDIEFSINTQLPSNEAANYGLSSSVAYSNVLNMTDNLGIESITAPNGTDRAEKLYIDQYWRMYSQPKVVMNTQIHNNGYSIFDTFTFSAFGKMIPFCMEINLKRDVVNLQCRQV